MITAKVTRIRDEAIDIKSFEFESVGGEALPGFTPGSHKIGRAHV